MKRTFRTVVYAVVTSGGNFRLFGSKRQALARAHELKELGVGSTLWKGKPTWRRLG